MPEQQRSVPAPLHVGEVGVHGCIPEPFQQQVVHELLDVLQTPYRAPGCACAHHRMARSTMLSRRSSLDRQREMLRQSRACLVFMTASRLARALFIGVSGEMWCRCSAGPSAFARMVRRFARHCSAIWREPVSTGYGVSSTSYSWRMLLAPLRPDHSSCLVLSLLIAMSDLELGWACSPHSAAGFFAVPNSPVAQETGLSWGG